MILDLDAVAAVHVARHAGDVERLAAIVTLHDRDHFRRHLAVVEQAAEPQHALQAERDLGLHVGELLLHELRRGQRSVELLAVERVLARAVHAVLGRAHHAPGDAVARAVEAAERTAQAGDVRQQRAFRHDDAVQHDLAGDRGAQRQLAADLRRGEALHSLFEDEALDLVVMRGRFRPDDEHVGDRRVGNPHLRAGETIAVRHLFGARLHAARIGAGIRLGEAETADPFAGRELRQIFLALLLGAVGIDRIHHQRRLHAVHRAIAGIDALDLARDQPVSDIACIGAAIFLRQRHADQAELAHLVENLAVGLFVEIGVVDARQQLLLRIGARGVADHALVFGQLIVQQQRVVPLELRFCILGRMGLLRLRAHMRSSSE